VLWLVQESVKFPQDVHGSQNRGRTGWPVRPGRCASVEGPGWHAVTVKGAGWHTVAVKRARWNAVTVAGRVDGFHNASVVEPGCTESRRVRLTPTPLRCAVVQNDRWRVVRRSRSPAFRRRFSQAAATTGTPKQ
jgi:hypothetical protein